MEIAKPSRLAYSEAPDPIRELIDMGVERLGEAANWKVRKRIMLDLIDQLRLAYLVMNADRNTLVEALRETLGEERFSHGTRPPACLARRST